MRYGVFVILFISFTLLESGCRKESINSLDCTGFKQGIVSNDEEKVRKSIAGLLGVYSQEKINDLAETISGNCGVTATVYCFECIKTLPPQSEILISFPHNGTTVRKLLDISYTTGNRMSMVAMHD